MTRTKKQIQAAERPTTTKTEKPKRVRLSRSKAAIAERMAMAIGPGTEDNAIGLRAVAPVAKIDCVESIEQAAPMQFEPDMAGVSLDESFEFDAEDRAMTRLSENFGKVVGLPFMDTMSVMHDVIEIVMTAGLWTPPANLGGTTLEAAALADWALIKKRMREALKSPEDVMFTMDVRVRAAERLRPVEAQAHSLRATTAG